MQNRIRHQTQQVFTDVSAGLDASPAFYSAEPRHIVLKTIGGLNMPQISTNPGHFHYPFFSKRQQAVNAEKKKTHTLAKK